MTGGLHDLVKDRQDVTALEQELLASPHLYSEAADYVFELKVSPESSGDEQARFARLLLQTTSKASIQSLDSVKQIAHKTLFALAEHQDTQVRILALRALTNLAAKTLRPSDKDLFSSYATVIAAALYPPRPSLLNVQPVRATVRSPSAQSFSAFGAFSRPRPQSRASSVSASQAETLSSSRTDSTQMQIDALQCLTTVATVSASSLHAHWHFFLPTEPISIRRSDNLLALLEFSKSSSVRLKACQAVDALLQGSLAFLNLADDRPTQASFTALSSRLAGTVAALHDTLRRVLKSRTHQHHDKFAAALIKLLNTVVSNSPYHRLSSTTSASDVLRASLDFLGLQRDASMDLNRSVLRAQRTILTKGRFVGTDVEKQILDSVRSRAKELMQRPDCTLEAENEAWLVLAAAAKVSADNSDATILATWVQRVDSSPQPQLFEGLVQFALCEASQPAVTSQHLSSCLKLCRHCTSATWTVHLAVIDLLTQDALLSSRADECVELLLTISASNTQSQALVPKQTIKVDVALCRALAQAANYCLATERRQRIVEALIDFIKSPSCSSTVLLASLQSLSAVIAKQQPDSRALPSPLETSVASAAADVIDRLSRKDQRTKVEVKVVSEALGLLRQAGTRGLSAQLGEAIDRLQRAHPEIDDQVIDAFRKTTVKDDG